MSKEQDFLEAQMLYQKQIAELEAKLAESESVRKGAIEEIKKLHKRINEIVERDKNIVENLNRQLEDKEEENLKLREKYIGLINMNVQEFNKLEKEIEKHNQDKISFAVEQLNQAKGKIQHNILFVDCNDYVNVIEEIDNQIEELKRL